MFFFIFFCFFLFFFSFLGIVEMYLCFKWFFFLVCTLIQENSSTFFFFFFFFFFFWWFFFAMLSQSPSWEGSIFHFFILWNFSSLSYTLYPPLFAFLFFDDFFVIKSTTYVSLFFHVCAPFFISSFCFFSFFVFFLWLFYPSYAFRCFFLLAATFVSLVYSLCL